MHNFRKSYSTLPFVCVAALALVAGNASAEAPAKASPHGEYRDWQLLGVSHRLDKKSLRAILGNATAIAASRRGNTLPWPDGTVLAKLVWNETTHPNWPQAVVPGEFSGAEAMVKDSKAYPDTGGWGFGRWQNGKLVMHDKTQSATCFACHAPQKANDYVYTFKSLQ